MLENPREVRRVSSFKINIDEGGAGKIRQNQALLTGFRTAPIKPMFSWILATQ